MDHKRKAVIGCKALELTKQQPVLVNGWFPKSPCLTVRDKLVARLLHTDRAGRSSRCPAASHCLIRSCASFQSRVLRDLRISSPFKRPSTQIGHKHLRVALVRSKPVYPIQRVIQNEYVFVYSTKKLKRVFIQKSSGVRIVVSGAMVRCGPSSVVSQQAAIGPEFKLITVPVGEHHLTVIGHEWRSQRIGLSVCSGRLLLAHAVRCWIGGRVNLLHHSESVRPCAFLEGDFFPDAWPVKLC